MKLPTLVRQDEREEVIQWLSKQGLGPQTPQWRFTNSVQTREAEQLLRGKWFLHRRPGDGTRTGYLCIYPEKSAVLYVEGLSRNPRIALLRIRVDPYMWSTGGQVLAATFSPVERTIYLEDYLFRNGVNVWSTQTYTTRFETMQQFLDEELLVDEKLMNGIKIECTSLDVLGTSLNSGVWEFIPDAPAKRRLLWINQMIRAESQVSETPIQEKYIGERIARAQPAESNAPDQYDLFAEKGESLGLAVIRGLALSKLMRQATADVPGACSVQVDWIAAFGRWEVKSISPQKRIAPFSFFKDHIPAQKQGQ